MIARVGKAGVPLEKLEANKYKCPETGEIYLQTVPEYPDREFDQEFMRIT
jgi:hypothetical protein